MSVFISIASYCDPLLGFTLRRALETARWPERLHFAVVDQVEAGHPPPRPDEVAPARLSLLRIDPVHARGPCWARAIAMSFYDGEDWFLQIDSHTEFDPEWDARLIAQAEALQPPGAGAVLSSYPDAFVLVDGQPNKQPSAGQVLAHVVKPGEAFAPDHAVLPFQAHPVAAERPLPGFHLGAGCLFAPGRLAREFPYDPAFYFHGEEQALALRLYTHGWDIFHVPRLPLYHLYTRPGSGAPPRPLHWDAAQEAARATGWWSLEQRSRQRLSDLVTGAALGVYGLGTRRSLAQYAQFSGIDYAARTIAPKAYAPLLTGT